MNCPNCNSITKPGDKFCTTCGYQYLNQVQSQNQYVQPNQYGQQPNQYAQQSGQYAQQPNQYAQQQGQYYGAQGQYQNMNTSNGKGGKKFPLIPVIIGGVALILLVVGTIVGIKLLGNDDSSEASKNKADSVDDEFDIDLNDDEDKDEDKDVYADSAAEDDDKDEKSDSGSETVEEAIDKLCNGLLKKDKNLYYAAIDKDYLNMLNSFEEFYIGVGTKPYDDDNASTFYEYHLGVVEENLGDIEVFTSEILGQEKVSVEKVIDAVFDGDSKEDIKEERKYVEDIEYMKGEFEAWGDKNLDFDDLYNHMTECSDSKVDFVDSIENADEILRVEVKQTIVGSKNKEFGTSKLLAVRKGKSWYLIPAAEVFDGFRLNI